MKDEDNDLAKHTTQKNKHSETLATVIDTRNAVQHQQEDVNTCMTPMQLVKCLAKIYNTSVGGMIQFRDMRQYENF